jgi:CRISPR type IV-associated protein Csf3
MLKNWRLTINMLTPLAVKPPALDALLMWELSNRIGMNRSDELNLKNAGEFMPEKLTRDTPLSQVKKCEHLPLCKKTIAGVDVFRCSDPIYRIEHEYHERQAKRFECDKMALLLREEERKSLLIASGPYKMRFVPIRCMLIPKVVYFFRGDKVEVRKLLKGVFALGKHRNIGYGFVKDFELEETQEDHSVFAGDVLMRSIPFVDDPKIKGARRSYGACKPPYWHPDNYMEILEPC